MYRFAFYFFKFFFIFCFSFCFNLFKFEQPLTTIIIVLYASIKKFCLDLRHPVQKKKKKNRRKIKSSRYRKCRKKWERQNLTLRRLVRGSRHTFVAIFRMGFCASGDVHINFQTFNPGCAYLKIISNCALGCVTTYGHFRETVVNEERTILTPTKKRTVYPLNNNNPICS